MPDCILIREASLGITGRGGCAGTTVVGTGAGTLAVVGWPARMAAGDAELLAALAVPAAATLTVVAVGAAGVGTGVAALALACWRTEAVAARSHAPRHCAPARLPPASAAGSGWLRQPAQALDVRPPELAQAR